MILIVNVNSTRSFFILNIGSTPVKKKISTIFTCEKCNIALGKPSKSQLWQIHTIYGVPRQCYLKEN